MVAAGHDPLEAKNVQASMFRRTGATIRCVELGQRELECMFQGRWSSTCILRLHLEWAAQEFDTSHTTYDPSVASFSEEARDGMSTAYASSVDPQDFLAFEPEHRLPAGTGLK